MNKQVTDCAVRLEQIEPNEIQIGILFEQLCQRMHNISHTEQPSYEQHASFVKQHPYRAWFLILLNEQAIGSIYAQHDNSLGLHLYQHCTKDTIQSVMYLLQSKLKPLEAIPSVRYGEFFLNVAYTNHIMQEALFALGYQPTQTSFILPE